MEGQVLLQRMKDVAKGIHTCASYLYSTIGRLHTEYLCFHKAISKLHYVTLRIYRTLLTKGICSAEEKDGEGGEGDGEGSGNVDGMTFEDDVEGTGMGEGEGKRRTHMRKRGWLKGNGENRRKTGEKEKRRKG